MVELERRRECISLKITIINGTNKRGTTNHIAHEMIRKLGAEETEIQEFFLPRDFGEYCLGCNTCFLKEISDCPHAKHLAKISRAIHEAELLVFVSPVYVYHVTGAMKNLLDHFGNRWMVHRPDGAMFQKTALLLTTAAGGGMKSTLKDLKDSMNFWGVGQIVTFGKGVHAVTWEGVPERIRRSLEKKYTKTAQQVRRKLRKKSPRFSVKALFYAMRFANKHFGLNEPDRLYYNQMGWLGKVRPWKSQKPVKR